MKVHWLPDEAAYLEQLVGDLPWPEVLRRFRTQRTRRGWPERTDRAVALRARRCGFRMRARLGECTTPYGAGELLGCSGERVAAWLKNQELFEILAPRFEGSRRYISREGWRRLARQRPDVLGGFGADALFLLLEDRELADQVAARYPISRGDFRVRCVETGQVWASASAAARELHVTPGAISLAIRQGRQLVALGLTFEALRRG